MNRQDFIFNDVSANGKMGSLTRVSEPKKYVEIGQRLQLLREALYPGMPVRQYALMLGLGYTRYVNWESGLNRPLPEQAEALCDRLGVTMDWIYRGIEAALPQNTAKALSERSLLNAQSKSTESSD